MVTFGAFAEILSGVEGLIHISELADHHVENPREVVNQGDEVNVKVIEIDPERRRLSLSLKRVEPGEAVKRIEMDGSSIGVAERAGAGAGPVGRGVRRRRAGRRMDEAEPSPRPTPLETELPSRGRAGA